MRAIAYSEFGGPDRLRPMALPRPRPGKGEALIRVVAAGVGAIDCAIRRGERVERHPQRFPVVPGWDFAGVVEELGEGAGQHRKGERVWGCAVRPTVQWGCYAEYVSLPETSLARMPAKLLFEEAASVPLAALVAAQCLAAAPRLGPESTVLIHAAAGGVGHIAVQLAKLAGAHVLGTASSASHPFLLGLGADVAIDYTAEDFREALARHRPDGADLVLDLVGGETLARSVEALKPGGRLVGIVEPPDAEAARERGASTAFVTVEPHGEELGRIARLFDQRKLETRVQKIYSLAEAAAAHEVVEQGHVKGKLVLNL